MRFLKKSVYVFTLAFIASTGFLIGSCFHRVSNADKVPYASLAKFSKVLQYIETSFVESVDIDQLVDGAIKGMLQTLDPHSAYLSPEIFKEMKAETSGKFGGLGVEVTIQDGKIVVVSPIDETPAFNAGIKSGDKIIKIGESSAIGITLPEAITLMRGKPGSEIKIAIERQGVDDPIDFTLKRELIKLRSVRGTIIKKDTLYVRISSFAERTSTELQKLMEENKGKSKGIILDLRGNPGGLLDQAIRVSNFFVDEGPIVYTIGRDKEKKEISYAQKERHISKMPVVVLVDSASASASEIVAGALQDHGRAVVAGQRTFGKGSVQTIIPLANEAGLKLTIARYYTPSGKSIQAKGIIPDVPLDYFDEEMVSQAKKRGQRIREEDLDGHFDNEGEKKLAETAETKAKRSKDFKQRVESDYMVAQAQGILKTMALIKNGGKKPEFKLEEHAKSL